MTTERLDYQSAGATRKREGVQPNTGAKYSMLDRDELLDIKRLINLMHAEIHNPGAARHITDGTFDLDHEVNEITYLIDHAVENAR